MIASCYHNARSPCRSYSCDNTELGRINNHSTVECVSWYAFESGATLVVQSAVSHDNGRKSHPQTHKWCRLYVRLLHGPQCNRHDMSDLKCDEVQCHEATTSNIDRWRWKYGLVDAAKLVIRIIRHLGCFPGFHALGLSERAWDTYYIYVCGAGARSSPSKAKPCWGSARGVAPPATWVRGTTPVNSWNSKRS